ncbi:MAG: 4-alpha-glucanotransferase [Lachnospiraceae bacterium]|nr:4-alpha-glucanotransferase [Lachnospiraceae bacterium]
MRSSGILMPIFSLPSKYGIGCFSKESYEFVDKLKKAGQKKWQILPLGPTGYGDSPYQSFSTFAGNPYFIDPETLAKEGLLTEKECKEYSCDNGDNKIDYEKLYLNRFKLLKAAFTRFKPTKEYFSFEKENEFWLEDYSLFMAIKDSKSGKSWTEWESELKNRNSKALLDAKERFRQEMDFYKFQQYEFRYQWDKLHKYANECGVEIVGDIPIYVALDSSDAWANPKLFQFDENNLPTKVAGCPPDAFSATGQLWGNPLFDWEYHKSTDYHWWIDRIKNCLKLYDIVRIDHFRGFDEYYAIPYGDKTAEFGKWMKGPGMDLFNAIKKQLGELNIIAEDLGFLTDSVIKLLSDSGFPGMKVLQFAFDSREPSNYLPHTYTNNCVVYTGTHDNTTTRAWYSEISKDSRDYAKKYIHKHELDEDTLAWDFISMAMSSVANLCIIPLQDYLCLGAEGRINQPSTLGGNWVWRMDKDAFSDDLAMRIKELTTLYGRD